MPFYIFLRAAQSTITTTTERQITEPNKSLSKPNRIRSVFLLFLLLQALLFKR